MKMYLEILTNSIARNGSNSSLTSPNRAKNQWLARNVPYIHPSTAEEPISRRRPRLLSPAEVRIIMFEFIDSGAPWEGGKRRGEERGHARGRRRRRTWRYQSVLYESVYEV